MSPSQPSRMNVTSASSGAAAFVGKESSRRESRQCKQRGLGAIEPIIFNLMDIWQHPFFDDWVPQAAQSAFGPCRLD